VTKLNYDPQLREVSVYFYISSLHIKRGKVSVPYVRMSETLGVASSVANDFTMRMTT